MKKFILTAFLAITTFGCIQAQTVKVIVSGIRNNDGKVLIMMQSDPQSQPLQNMKTAIKDTCSFIFPHVQTGNYKISVFHDENGNFQIDKDEKGIPTEGFAIKNAQIHVDADHDTQTITIKLFYPPKAE